jgi:hypothetical protein
MAMENAALVRVLKDAIHREKERIRRAEEEIFKLQLELLELGVELPSDYTV